jgi:nucleotide-binding universal stress UspA family protein
MFPIRKILHPTDFSEHSQAAFELACALARDYSAELIVLHVNRSTAIFAPDGIAVAAPTEEPLGARAKLAQVRPVDPRVRVEHRLIEGEPAEQILKAAAASGADLIVLGTHGTTGLMRVLMGSVAEDVLRKAPCPVLTVRSPLKIGATPMDVKAPAPK